MGKKKSPPKPPKIPIPTPSAEEIALQQKQLGYMDMMTQYGQQSMQYGQDDRAKAMGILDTLQQAPQLDQGRMDLINQIAQAGLGIRTSNITQGANKEIFDTNRRDTLASLADQGILNSTFGRQAIENLYKEQSRQLQGAGDQTALDRMNMENQWLQTEQNKNMGLFNTLYGGAGDQMNQGNNQLGAAANTAANVSGQMKSNRMDAYNANVSNIQSEFVGGMRDKQKSGKAGMWGALGGAAIGGLLAIPTGGLSIAAGATLGAGLGGTVGSLF